MGLVLRAEAVVASEPPKCRSPTNRQSWRLQNGDIGAVSPKNFFPILYGGRLENALLVWIAFKVGKGSKMGLKVRLIKLLGYMDDTLEPVESLEVGQRIQKSKSTQAAMTEIGKIMRRRRLRAAEADPELADVDANTVAAYLDQTMPPPESDAFEEKALSSEILLAEVASAHQILSIVESEPADVPSKNRDRIVAMGGASPAAPRSKVRPYGVTPPERTLRSLADSSPGQPSIALPVSLYPSEGLLAKKWVSVPLILSLIGLLVFLISKTVAPGANNAETQIAFAPPSGIAPAKAEGEPTASQSTETPKPDEKPVLDKPKDEPAKALTSVVENDINKPVAAGAPAKTNAEPTEKAAEPAVAEAKEKTTKAAEKSTPKDGEQLAALAPSRPLPPKPEKEPRSATESVAAAAPLGTLQNAPTLLLVRSNGVLARRKPGALLYSQDQLLHLDGSRSTLELPHQAALELFDQCRLNLKLGKSADFAFDLEEGRVALRNGDKPTGFEVVGDESTLGIRLVGSNSLLVLDSQYDRVITAERNDPPSRTVTLQLIRGEAELTLGSNKQRLSANQQITLDSMNRLNAPVDTKSAPAWFTKASEVRPPLKLAERIKYEGSVELSLREALNDRLAEIRRQAASALALCQEWNVLVHAIVESKNSEVRQVTIPALRTLLQRDPLVRVAARNELVESELMVEKDAERTLDLVRGISNSESKKKQTYIDLVKDLASENQVLCELAIFNLKEITLTDRGYQLDQPISKRGPAIEKWRIWAESLNENSLPPKRGGKAFHGTIHGGSRFG